MRSPRGGHVASGKDGRRRKAEKIEALLAPHVTLSECDVLDLGAGSGLLSDYMHPRVRSLVAADRDIGPFEPKNIEIRPTDGPRLPFDEASFDLVLYNHVIEHVGTRAEQREALADIRRVLRPDGLLYLAVPNRYTLIEPHYKLPLLSWLPQTLADRWVRARGQNDWYDCNPFASRELTRFLTAANFQITDTTTEAFYALLRIEKADSWIGSILSRTPRSVISALKGVMPTFVMICRRDDLSQPTTT